MSLPVHKPGQPWFSTSPDFVDGTNHTNQIALYPQDSGEVVMGIIKGSGIASEEFVTLDAARLVKVMRFIHRAMELAEDRVFAVYYRRKGG